MRSSSVVVNDTDSLPLARGVATSVPVDTTTSSGSGPESQNVTPDARRGGREEAHADQVEELDVDPLGHPVEPVEQLVGHVRERLDQRHARVVDVVIRPAGAALLHEALRVVDELLEAAVVEVGCGKRHVEALVGRLGTGAGRPNGTRSGRGQAAHGTLVGDRVEREHEVPRIVRAADRVRDVDEEGRRLARIRADLDRVHVDPRLPAAQRRAHLVGDAVARRGIGRGEDVVVDAAAEVGPHRALALGRGQDQADRLLDLALALDHGEPAGRVDAQRERDALPDELLTHRVLLIRRARWTTRPACPGRCCRRCSSRRWWRPAGPRRA